MLLCGNLRAQLQPVVGIDFDISSSRSVPDHWVKFVGMNWQKKTNIPFDDGTPSDIDVLITDNDTSNNVTYNMSHGSGDNTPQHIQPLAETLGGASMCRQDVTVTWSDLKPGVEYNIFVFASNVVNGPTSQTVTITGDGTDDPPPFTQIVESNLIVNESESTNQSLTSFAKLARASVTGEIHIHIDGPGSVWLSGLAISERERPCFTDVTVTNMSNPAVEASSSITAVDAINRSTYLSAPEVFFAPEFCLAANTLLEVTTTGCN